MTTRTGTSPSNIVERVVSLGFPYPTSDPFLVCVHHVDAYPAGNEHLGPAASLAGRRLGEDFEIRDGFRMYHGDVVPGFPRHPHRGFETVTVVRRGYIDHSDSLGATARYGEGDVQWLTAGRGIEHAEMFPLLERGRPNPLELFQIWLNLPRVDKLAEPRFAMFWDGSIPRHRSRDDGARETEVTIVAGELAGLRAPPPPAQSWAARPESRLAIWIVRLAAGARFVVPGAEAGLSRALYFFRGGSLSIAGTALSSHAVVHLRSDADAVLENGPVEAEVLLLQGRPIGEPVTQYGPFVMNERDEIRRAFADYQQGAFGRWPWPSDAPVHPRGAGRFARLAGGEELRPEAIGDRPR